MSKVEERLVAQCLVALRDQGSATIGQLSASTKLSRPTIAAVLEELQAKGLVEQDESKAAPGRPARTFHLTPGRTILVGLDLSRRTVHAVIADRTGRVILQPRTNLASPTNAQPDLEALRQFVVDAVAQSGRGMADVAGIGVAVAGLLDENGVMISAPQVHAWTGKNIAEMLGALFGRPTTVDNDLALAADGELRAGALRDVETGAYVLTWHHVSARVTSAGKVVRGRRGRAGEVGLLNSFSNAITPKGELISAVEGVGARIRRLADDPNDADALDAVQTLSEAMAPSVAALILTVDPDCVVLGGELGQYAWAITGPLEKQIRASLNGIDISGNDIRGPELGEYSATLGALGAAFETFSTEVYGYRDVLAPVTTIAAKSPVVEISEQAHQKTFRTAVIGVGARAGLALHVREAHGDVVAAVDTDSRTAAEAARLFGQVPFFSSTAELLASGIDIDGAIVTTPDFTHADVAVELLEAGVPVYLEKPMAITIEDADRILETAFRTNTKLYVGHNMRHMQVVRMMKQIIDRGEIGEVKAIWTRHFVGNGGDFYFKDWHAERDKVTSLLLQKGAHDLDVMHWLAGAVSRDVVGIGDLAVYGDVASRRDNSDRRMWDWFSMDNWPPGAQTDLNPVIDVEDISMIMMRTNTGVLMSYQQCHFTPDYWRNYTVIGTEGRLENSDDGEGGEIRVWNARSNFLERGHTRYAIGDGGDGGHGGADPRTVAEFIELVRSGAPTDTNPIAAREAVAAGVAGAASIRNGSAPQTIPELPHDLVEYFTQHQPVRL